MDNEPSILDYLKSRLNPRKYGRIEIPGKESDIKIQAPVDDLEIKVKEPVPTAKVVPAEEPDLEPEIESPITRLGWPWRSLLALLLALSGQSALEPPDRSLFPALGLYFLALVFLFWAVARDEWPLSPQPATSNRPDPLTVRRNAVMLGAPLALAAFIAFSGNLFSPSNVIVWTISLAAFVWAFWLREPGRMQVFERFKAFISRDSWNLRITPWSVLVIAVIASILFFRLYALNQVPAEPISDHVEKLFDVRDVLAGKTHIFFPRNTGREAFQMYLTAAVALVFGTGLSFLSLKIGTVLAGLGALPFIYLLGKEIANRRVALLALLFAGIAYWPNIISRFGLRFPLYPLFAAPFLYFLVRGLRRMDRNDFILAGLFLGAGMHGYSTFRLMPVVAIVAVGLFIMHRQSKESRAQVLWAFLVMTVMALLVFLPLMRYSLEDPQAFFYRSLTRLTDAEKALPGPVWEIFLSNLWQSLGMFNWSNGTIWVHSIPFRPALDVVSAALLIIGVALLLVRYARERNWLDLFLLVSIPLLMLPSILSLAFPGENPSLNRSATAIVPVFLIVALAIDGLLSAIESRLGGQIGKVAVWGVTGIIVLMSVFQNFDLVFNKYAAMYRQNAWNTSEMGELIALFDRSISSQENAWVVGFPHWVDTRLVGVWAGFPQRDFAIWPESFPDTLPVTEAKLFLIKPEDQDSIALLADLYPQGSLSRYPSAVENKDFLMFFVPPISSLSP